MAAKAKKPAKKVRSAQREFLPPQIAQIGYARPTAAEIKAAEARERDYRRQQDRTTALHTVAQVHMGSGKPAHQLLREADAYAAWLSGGVRK